MLFEDVRKGVLANYKIMCGNVELDVEAINCDHCNYVLVGGPWRQRTTVMNGYASLDIAISGKPSQRQGILN